MHLKFLINYRLYLPIKSLCGFFAGELSGKQCEQHDKVDHAEAKTIGVGGRVVDLVAF